MASKTAQRQRHTSPPVQCYLDLLKECVRGLRLSTGPGQRKDGLFGLRCASSWHKGGVNLAMADGTVRFLADDIDPSIYTGLFSKDLGEITIMQQTPSAP